ncbi:MAG: MFS transporter [Microcystaceae cyanobacterium]
MTAFLHLTPSVRRNLILLFITAFFFWTSLTCLLPTLPVYIEKIGGTPQQVGFVMGGFAIGLLASRVWLGKLADNRSRKLVVLIGTFVAATAPIGYMIATSIPTLLIIRGFHGISVAAFTTGYSALVVDLSPRKQRGEIIGYMTLAVPIGMAIGPMVGGFMASSLSFTLLFGFSALSASVSFILASQIKEKKCTPNQEEIIDQSLSPPRSFVQLAQQKSLVIPAVILLLIGLLFGTLITFMPLFVRTLPLEINIGLFYTFAAIASFATRLFSGKASDKYGRGVFITGSLVCYGLSMILLATLNNPLNFFLSAILEGIGAGILIPMLITLISDRSQNNERGKVYSFCIGGFDVGIALAGPVIGSLNTLIGYRGMFILATQFAIVGLILFVFFSNKTRQDSWRFALGKTTDHYAVK